MPNRQRKGRRRKKVKNDKCIEKRTRKQLGLRATSSVIFFVVEQKCMRKKYQVRLQKDDDA